jgi:hypothetical protein
MAAPISQAEMLSLERLLPHNDNDLPATEPEVEEAIEKLLVAARYHLFNSLEFGIDWWSVAYQLLPLDGKADLLPDGDFGPEDVWIGKWSEWRGNTELFLELYSALRLLLQKNQTIRSVASGAKGGASPKSSELAEEVRVWYAKAGRFKRPNKSASLDYLIGNWNAFASEHGLDRETPPDKKSLYRYLKQLPHQPD